MTLKQHFGTVAMLALLTAHGLAQATSGSVPSDSSNTPSPWAYSLTTSGYIVPGGQSYILPDFTADHGWLHLEARYNSEALRTGSLWACYNFSVGTKLMLNATPMLGGVFGDLNGIAPGCLLTLTYKRVQLYAANEYVFSFQNRYANFFYTWNQLTYSPLPWLQVGLASQRTRVYQTGLDIQRGVLAGVTYKKMTFTTTVFNFGWTTPTDVLSLGFNF
ncbi:MAG TPA: hypothetical protein VIX37_01015 [Candidatus Sulfotelmatobacter sp.]